MSKSQSKPGREVSRSSAPGGAQRATAVLGASTLPLDPRWFQILSLSLLLLYGLIFLSFDIEVSEVMTALAGVLFFQLAFSRLLRVRFEAKSALISGLSLCLLLRAGSPLWYLLGAFITIGSKFLIRARGKHVFNPTNFGIVVLLLLTSSVWVSPGQWGSAALFAFFIFSLGAMVVFRSLRSDTALAFLVFYPGLLVLRALRLGDPLVIPLHQLENGALLLFTFFMISDPRTTPNTRVGRITFCFIVALVAYHIRFTYFHPNALLYSLAGCTLLVPVLDRIFGGEAYDWLEARRAFGRPSKETA